MSTPVEQIKERLSIEEVIGSYVKLEKSGKNLKARCPFHNEKTPSFYVSPDRGGFFCFGCGAKGDIFSFVEQFEGLDFMGALKLLADKAGVDITRTPKGGFSGDYAVQKSEKDRLYSVMEDAALFFEENLSGHVPRIDDNTLYSMARDDARAYIKKRGITDATVKEFRIGFVPKEWRLLYNHLKSKGYSDVDIEKAGLAKRPESSEASPSGATSSAQVKSLYDRFRDRVMFPIFDSSGRVIAFSGRILHEDEGTAKYLNSPDTPLYNKSTVLYGIDKAKQAIRERGYTILVEGQMDLVLSHQAGIKNTVAVSGTALADTLTVGGDSGAVNNLGIVRRLSPNLILAFDSDTAGRKAAMRSAEIALTLGMDVKIADLPEGLDPADMVLADPESWKNALRAAKPVVEFQLDQVLAESIAKKLDLRKIPALLREKVYPFIAMLSGQTEQGYYVKMVRERALNNAENEAIIWEDINAARKVRQAKQQQTPSQGTGQPPVGRATISANGQASHLDIISRKLFGLLAYIARENILSVDGYTTTLKNIAGEERYNNLIQKIEPSKDELIFEAELFFGRSDDLRNKPDVIEKHIRELILNFEEDLIREDFAKAMAELGALERNKDKGTADVYDAATAELLQKCQKLSARITEIAKMRSK